MKETDFVFELLLICNNNYWLREANVVLIPEGPS